MQAGVLQDIRLDACLKAKARRLATPRGLFWLAFDWCKQVKQVSRSP